MSEFPLNNNNNIFLNVYIKVYNPMERKYWGRREKTLKVTVTVTC